LYSQALAAEFEDLVWWEFANLVSVLPTDALRYIAALLPQDAILIKIKADVKKRVAPISALRVVQELVRDSELAPYVAHHGQDLMPATIKMKGITGRERAQVLRCWGITFARVYGLVNEVTAQLDISHLPKAPKVLHS
jgi:hypothetical protein